jgi:hypothetical protein
MEDLNLNPETKKVEYAGFWLRFVAYIIDAFIIGIAESVIVLLNSILIIFLIQMQ